MIIYTIISRFQNPHSLDFSKWSIQINSMLYSHLGLCRPSSYSFWHLTCLAGSFVPFLCRFLELLEESRFQLDFHFHLCRTFWIVFLLRLVFCGLLVSVFSLRFAVYFILVVNNVRWPVCSSGTLVNTRTLYCYTFMTWVVLTHLTILRNRRRTKIIAEERWSPLTQVSHC